MHAHSGTGVIEGSIFALLGLLVAFTFSSAGARFDSRRQLIVQEANAIETAYLRTRLLPPARQEAVQALFKKYLQTRISVYQSKSFQEAGGKMESSEQIQEQIWAEAMAGAKDGPMYASMLLLPALNQMFDIANERNMALRMHVPSIILAMLFALGIICAVLAGYSMSDGLTRNWLHRMGFALILAVTFYVILDLEYPRRGFIRVDSFDQALIRLESVMK